MCVHTFKTSLPTSKILVLVVVREKDRQAGRQTETDITPVAVHSHVMYMTTFRPVGT